MDREEIRDRTLQALNEDVSSPIFFSLNQIDRFIDEAMETLAEEVADIRRTAYLPKRQGTIYYSIHQIADNVMAPYRLTLDEEDERLQYILMDELDRSRQRWMEDTADNPDWWFPVSWDVFGVWPGTATSDGYIRVDYLAWPDALIDDGDEPEFNLEAHDAMTIYGIMEGLLHQWDTARAIDYWTQFVSLWRDRSAKTEANKLRHGFYAREQFGDRPIDIVGSP